MLSNDVPERGLIAAEVRAELARQRKTRDDVASILGFSRQAADWRITGKQSFRADELMRLAVALGVPISRFFPTREPAA